MSFDLGTLRLDLCDHTQNGNVRVFIAHLLIWSLVWCHRAGNSFSFCQQTHWLCICCEHWYNPLRLYHVWAVYITKLHMKVSHAFISFKLGLEVALLSLFSRVKWLGAGSETFYPCISFKYYWFQNFCLQSVVYALLLGLFSEVLAYDCDPL
jgi:hypothetical protein